MKQQISAVVFLNGNILHNTIENNTTITKYIIAPFRFFLQMKNRIVSKMNNCTQ